MTVVDARTLLQQGTEASPLEYDMCIVGSGPAGSTLARELSNTSLTVVVLESGGFERNPGVDALNEIENVGWPRRLDQWAVRNRIVGGTSHTWWGRCAPFDAIDFEGRPWVPFSGWPIARQDLDDAFRRSEAYLGLPADFQPAKDDRLYAEALDDDGGSRTDVVPSMWRYSSDPDERLEPMRFGRRLPQQLGPNVSLVTDATVLRVRPSADGNRHELAVTASDGTRGTVVGRRVVLAAGAVENARLLLASRLGNDLVGRFLMDHPRGPVARFDLAQAPALLERFGFARSRGTLYMRGFRLSPRVQREQGLLNASSWLSASVAPDDPWEAAKRLARRGSEHRTRDLGDLLRGAPLVARGTARRLRGRRSVPHRWTSLTLEAMCEQRPDPDSRITLAERTDRFGVPLSRIDWHVNAEDARALRSIARLVSARLEELGFTPPVLEDWVRDEGMPPATFTDISHPTGTTRMSADPARGVVDADGQVHGVPGLFVAGSAVFPTAGQANPTQTIVALAIRLADHLRDAAAAQL